MEAKFNSAWEVAIYIGRAAKNKDIIAVLKDDGIFRQFRENEIRPLTDTAAHLDAKP